MCHLLRYAEPLAPTDFILIYAVSRCTRRASTSTSTLMGHTGRAEACRRSWICPWLNWFVSACQARADGLGEVSSRMTFVYHSTRVSSNEA